MNEGRPAPEPDAPIQPAPATEIEQVVRAPLVWLGAPRPTWSDERVDHFRRGDPEDLAYPYILPATK